MATHLGLLFWKDLENHHPGISSLNLAPDIAAAWKQRIRTKPARAAGDDGSARARLPRADVASCLNAVRAFYLDIAQWAAEEPQRWGQWAARCPVRAADPQTRKERSHRKSRMDQRTRERLPSIPVLAAALDHARHDAAGLLAAARTAGAGEQFTAAGQTLRRAGLTGSSHRIWAEADTRTRPDLTDVLATILQRVGSRDGAVPLVIAYDSERVWNPPMPLLFQHRAGMEDRPFAPAAIRRLLSTALACARLTDATGRPLRLVPHDFRRIFTTEAMLNGMPPHIAQLLLGHTDINVTMGYKAVYPDEAISGHRAFIARRRQLRPSDEYRTPTDAEAH